MPNILEEQFVKYLHFTKLDKPSSTLIKSANLVAPSASANKSTDPLALSIP